MAGCAFLLVALVRTVPELRLLFSVVEAILHVAIRHGGFRDFDRMHEALRVRTYVCLHAEEPLVPLLRLVHLRIALLLLVLHARRSCHDGGICDGAVLHGDAASGKKIIHDDEKLFL